MTSDSGPVGHLNINTESQCEQIGTLPARAAKTAIRLRGEYMSLNVLVEFSAEQTNVFRTRFLNSNDIYKYPWLQMNT